MPQSADGVFRLQAPGAFTQSTGFQCLNRQMVSSDFAGGKRISRGSQVSMPQSADGVFRHKRGTKMAVKELFQCLNRQMVSSDAARRSASSFDNPFQCLNRQMVSSDDRAIKRTSSPNDVSMPQSADGVFRRRTDFDRA